MEAKPQKQFPDYGSLGYARLSTTTTTFQLPLTSSCVTCKVCQSYIDIIGKRHQYVVKCNECNEATPIRNAPKGKRYIRCGCKCLLVCRDAALRVSCPRSNCKRTISLISSLAYDKVPVFMCAYCSNPFRFDLLQDSLNVSNLVKCPRHYCKRISSVGGRDLARKWAMIFLMLSAALFTVGIALVCSTTQAADSTNGGIYVAYIGFFLIALICLLRSYHYWTMKVSRIEGTV